MHSKTFFSILVGISLLCPVQGMNCPSQKTISAPIKHGLWNSILEANVDSEGGVDYQGIRADKNFNKYLDLLSANHPNENWSMNEQMAFWINAYNAFTIQLILNNWPVSSIKEIDSPWNQSFISIETRVYSLNDIEHKILRKKFEEPRIHFAINCASFSCPVLAPFAFEAKSLDAQLDMVTRAFVNDQNRNIITGEKMQISRIFKWFEEDFTQHGSLQDYFKNYTSVGITNATKIEYLEYNWSLNGQNN